MMVHSKTLRRFTDKLNADAALHALSWKYTVDPGKFGRVAAAADLDTKYRVCVALNAHFLARGKVTLEEVTRAFRDAGL